MIKNRSIICALLFASTFLFSCGNNQQNVENTDSTKSENMAQKPAFEYDQVIKAQDSLMIEFSWPAKHELDLNDDGVNEEFLAIEGYSRGMGYALFSKENHNWKLISGDESIASGHLGVEKSEKMNGGWHDFVALQPSGRDGIIESYYSWNGQKYILKEQKEIENKNL